MLEMDSKRPRFQNFSRGSMPQDPPKNSRLRHSQVAPTKNRTENPGWVICLSLLSCTTSPRVYIYLATACSFTGRKQLCYQVNQTCKISHGFLKPSGPLSGSGVRWFSSCCGCQGKQSRNWKIQALNYDASQVDQGINKGNILKKESYYIMISE